MERLRGRFSTLFRVPCITGHFERYAGGQPVSGNDTVIRSRHIQHVDNTEAVTALVADLQQIGHQVSRSGGSSEAARPGSVDCPGRSQISPALPALQVYPAPGEPDPAEQRSGDSSFHLAGYPACLISENLFAGPGIGSPAEMNPNYHLPADAMINAGYAAYIARAVTAAAWVAATR